MDIARYPVVIEYTHRYVHMTHENLVSMRTPMSPTDECISVSVWEKLAFRYLVPYIRLLRLFERQLHIIRVKLDCQLLKQKSDKKIITHI